MPHRRLQDGHRDRSADRDPLVPRGALALPCASPVRRTSMDTVADITARDDARWTFIEMQARPLVLSRWLSAGLVLAVVVILALAGALMYLGHQMAHLKPVVVRIDGVGRAEAVTYDAATWRPQIPELRYF